MRHLNSYRKLGRRSDHRKAMLRNMATSFLEHGKIVTTVQRAKTLRPIVEKLITLGKKGGLHCRRQAASVLFSDETGRKLFTELADRFKTRPGGYTRIIRSGRRAGDDAELCFLELVDYREHEGKAKFAAVKEATAKKKTKQPARAEEEAE